MYSKSIYAQLGFCSGNSGDPIFTETFGVGTGNNALPSGTTTYFYTNGYPNDGSYTVSNGIIGNGFDWHEISDHTIGDSNGKCLIVNAAASAGEFYRTTVSGLCEATTYQFSAWLINLVKAGGFCSNQPGGAIPINVSFEIWDSTDTNLLKGGNTGNINESSFANWQENGLVFQTLAGQDTVILKMINNSNGGCGNDLAIDDIEFKSCGDFITIEDSNNDNFASLCSSQGSYVSTLTVTPDFSVYSDHYYQWQVSTDGVVWNDIISENSQSLLVSTNSTSFYRAKVAEVAINLSNPLCVSYSNEFEVAISQLPPMPSISCWQTATINTTTCAWDIAGTQPVMPSTACWETLIFNTSTCTWNVTGTKPVQPILACWESTSFNTSSCSWDVTGTQPGNTIEEHLSFCEDNTLLLSVQTNISNPSFVWGTGDITESILIDRPGRYTVEVTGGVCSFETRIFNITKLETPIIEDVVPEESNIVITTVNKGDFLYSIDGVSFQSNNIFYNVPGGLYTVSAKQQNCNSIVSTQYMHFHIPKYFTPNGDGINDKFDLSGIEYFGTSQVAIFNRYGKLLKSSRNTSFTWDGTFKNEKMPTTDYWYVIIIDDQKFMGHVTLKR